MPDGLPWLRVGALQGSGEEEGSGKRRWEAAGGAGAERSAAPAGIAQEVPVRAAAERAVARAALHGGCGPRLPLYTCSRLPPRLAAGP